ncbi:CPBP family intramembrane glutamic endopeptidase [Brevibacillus dissolubilis]|uniref:CPBP family intramembrane glutamic endopeptidase n=1 Tax=Brevibacillus dissolubilis TaxID=1844116 RepID=UPI001116BCF3|nr:CPBP family intramembrane glutamic endopeptidase [Brevibacillus dissolubilis]
MAKQRNLRIALFFTILGVIAAFAIVPYQLSLLGGDAAKSASVPLPVLYTLMALQTGALVLIASVLGLRMASRVGLGTPILREWLYERRSPSISKQWIWYSILFGALGAILIALLDLFVFVPNIPQLAGVETGPWWTGLLTLLYGGIVEEVQVRLFLMTLFVWLLAVLTKKSNEQVPAGYYWFGILAATLIFGALHLPTTASALGGLTTLVVIRALILNGLLGVWFGYLYWRKGLEYAIISHATADLFLHTIVPAIL